MAETKTQTDEGRLSSFFKSVRKEFYKITWPPRGEVIRRTTAVSVVSVICGIIIAVFDAGFGALMNLITTL